MNQRLWIGLPATLLTVLGTTLSSYALPSSAVSQKSEVSPTAAISGTPQQAELENSEDLNLDKGYKRRYRNSARQGAGMASYYGDGGDSRTTASGEYMTNSSLTAAHRSLPFGTRVRVTNMNNNRSVVVRINDRGPFIGGRVIDLSLGAARNLGMMGSGVAPVRLQVLGR
jgi:rare lipoprotein A